MHKQSLSQFKDRKVCEALHLKYLTGFDERKIDQRSLEVLVGFFYSAFTNYNVQMWGMLPGDILSCSWENAMQMLAVDSVYRYVEICYWCLLLTGVSLEFLIQNTKKLVAASCF